MQICLGMLSTWKREPSDYQHIRVWWWFFERTGQLRMVWVGIVLVYLRVLPMFPLKKCNTRRKHVVFCGVKLLSILPHVIEAKLWSYNCIYCKSGTSVIEVKDPCTKYDVVFSRYVLECEECGVIYRSRQYWYGNTDPEKTIVRTQLKHIWQGVSQQEIAFDSLWSTTTNRRFVNCAPWSNKSLHNLSWSFVVLPIILVAFCTLS
jgi:hypothetical protein